MTILIFGKGYVALKFKYFFDSLPVEGRPKVIFSGEDIADPAGVDAALTEFRPDVVLNCAGKTGRPNIDWCEDASFDPASGQSWLDSNQGLTWRSNVLGPQVLASRCAARGIYMVHVGSGCIYEGDNGGKGFSEDDAPNFRGSFYSLTKIASEQALALVGRGSSDSPNTHRAGILQVRLRMPFDGRPGLRNFVTKITKYPKIISMENSISVMDDFVRAVHALIQKRARGIFNVTNPGSITHAEILDSYKELVDPSFTYQVISLDDLHQMTAAKRSNCVLSSKRLERALEDTGARMRPVKEAVRAELTRYGALYPEYMRRLKEAKGIEE